jgi:hypothetical protein
MTTKTTIRTVLAVLLLTTTAALAQDNLKITWGPNAETVSYDLGDTTTTFPQDIVTGSFPAPGEPVEFTYTSKWPVFSYRNRWSSDLTGWSDEDRAAAIDIILMRCVDVADYPTVYPDKVISTQILEAPQIGADHELLTVASKLRGKEIKYEMLTSGGGWPAPDTHIETTFKIGASADGKTIFYTDDSTEIDESITRRAVVFAAHDTGTVVYFELRGEYVGKDRLVGQGTVMSRLKETATYLGGRMEDYLDNPPTEADLAKYNSLNGERSAANEQGISDETSSNFLTADPTSPSLKDLKADMKKDAEKPWVLPVVAGGVTGFIIVTVMIRRRRKHAGG